MKLKPLSNFDIINICKKLKIPLINVVSKDELYNIPRINGFYVVNLQNSNDGNGTHWTCLLKRNDVSLYFDSYGFICPISVIDFLKPSIISYNINDIQHLNSILCGYFCIGIMKYLLPYVNDTKKLLNKYNDFINLFSESEIKNDKILMKLFSI